MATADDNIQPDLSQAEKSLKETLTRTGQITRDITAKAFRELIGSVEEYGRKLKSIENILEDQLDTYSSISNKVADLGAAISSQKGYIQENKSLLRDTAGIYNALKKMTGNLVDNQRDIVTGQISSRDISRDIGKALSTSTAIELRLKDIKNQSAKLEEDAIAARRRGNLDKAEDLQAEILALKDISGQLDLQKSSVDEITAEYEKQYAVVSKTEKTLALASSILGGLKKIPFIGKTLDLEAAEARMKGVADSGGNLFQTLGAGAKSVGSSLSAALGPLALIQLAVDAVKMLVEMMFAADKQVTDIARNLGISKEEASGVRDYFYEVADTAQDYSTTLKGTILLQKDIVATQFAFNDALGTSIVLQRENLQQLTIAKTIIQLSEEAMTGLSIAFATTGKDAEDVEKSILGTARAAEAASGIFVQEKKVLEGVLKASGGIKLNFKGSYEALALAVTKAIQLGTTMEKVESTTSSLLNFESSIQAQMEAELLTGKEINLNAARYYALTNQTDKLMDEMAKNMGDYNEYSQMNRLTQEAYAKSLGMSRDDMADMLLKQKAIGALRRLGNYDDKKSILEQFELLEKSGKTQKEIAETLGEQAYKALLQESAQDKFAKALDKAKEAFEKLVDGGTLDKLVNLVTDLVQSLVKHGGFSTFFGRGVKTERISREETEASATLTQYQGVSNEKLTPEQRAEIDAAHKILQERVARDQETQRESIQSEKRSRSYKADMGDFTINPLPEDTITASGGNSGITVQGGTRLGRTDEMVAELKEQNRILMAILAKDTTIKVDGQTLANTVGVNVPVSYGNLLNPGSSTYYS